MAEEIKVQLPKRAFNKVYIDYLNEASRYLVFYGGAGSGKSYYIAERYILNMMQRPVMNILTVRAVGNTNRDSTFALFKQIISKWGLSKLFKVTESDLRITCTNGNSILFKGLDDSEKLKSITFAKGELTDIWIEEASETLEADFNQLNIRLRGKGTQKQIVVSFNPIDINHWLKKRFFDRKDDNIKIVHTTYKDNRFLDDDYVTLLESYKNTDPYYYSVYCLGQWGVFGKTIFDAQKVSERLSQIKEPIKTGSFSYETYYNKERNAVLIKNDSIKWVDEPNGYISIHKDVIERYPYVIGGDTAGEGSDNFTGQVLDNTTGEQVAVLLHQFDEDIYAKQMYCLGSYYNWALLSPETNYSTYPVKELERLEYPKMYMREREDDLTHRLVKSYGFQTTRLTRPIIIAALVKVVRENIELINDRKTLEEMLTFVRNEKGRPEAQNGAHDDLIMGLAIAHYIRPQQSFIQAEEPQPQKKYNFDFERERPDPSGYGDEVKVI
jgi:phage terminase large subunit